ncbi:helix-turn-helix transcriptional regulator [Saccharopolyspora sp. K220]|uniref:helix-turn-helix transcriptional regulator n=1 Tax=Saccharopolyspora soli TaxID=2926618 RepID=UPI001F590F0D|nr:helix-turn-helix transcriptional regulator [Saccharopolyspora soli]MCI2421931.1 helix-turn-helix transcriptional regulator [Saccharopolyspora soli]
MRDNELGVFLRARREAIAPAEVGLPTGPRRRTPGLRRAELATLAGISVEYLTRLEQGRDRHPSAEVLGALLDALQLSAEDRSQLFLILGYDKPAALCPRVPDPPVQAVRPGVQAILDRLEPGPALVVNRISDVLACTDGYQRLAGPVGVLDGAPPNLLRFLFTDGRARTAHPEWGRAADSQVNFFKLGFHPEDAHSSRIAEELADAAGYEFTARSESPPAVPERTGVQRWVHPEVGELRLGFEVLELPDADNQQMIIYLPDDEATAAALDRLNGRHPGALRAVPG